MLPLSGLRVLDITKFIAGPLCTQYLGAMGAEVLKIEDPDGGDGTRGMPPFIGNDGATYLAMNCNKRSLAIDLKTEQGRQIVYEIAATSDIVVESLAPGSADKLGVGWEALAKINPRIIYCAISGFGRSGPLGSQPGYEVMMQAFTGLMSVTGEPNSDPFRVGFSPLDQTTGLHALTGVLAALRMRDTTGTGNYIEVSLYETAAALLGWHAQSYWIDGKLPERCGSRHASLCPYQAFAASDGLIVIAVGSEHLWRRFCAATDLMDMCDDPRFRTNVDRVSHYEETIDRIQARIITQTVAHWTATLSEYRIPNAPVNTLETMLQHPQTEARGIILDFDHPVGGRMHAVAHPVVFGGRSREVSRPPPLLGEHTVEVLAELGYGTESISQLKNNNVIRTQETGSF